MPADAEILPPRYSSALRVGRGATGEVYRAEDVALGRAVAVKVLAERYADDPATGGRFKREALASARLSTEPHVVTLYDVGEWNGRPFIVMEYLAGGSVADRISAAPPTFATALSWLAQAGQALDAAHARGVVHRDVKPANLLLDREGELRVADFGIASATGLDSFTATGTVLGTAGYLAPEQARGERATPASDRYALAVVAFELLTGRRPFASDSPTAEAAAHVQQPVPSASELRRDLPLAVDTVFARALAKEPASRYGSCAGLVEALREALAAGAAPTTVLAPGRAGAPAPARARRSPWGPRALVAVAAVAAAAAGAVTAAIVAGGGGQAPETLVVTRTAPGADRTIRETGTAAPAPPPAPVDAHALNDQGYALMGRANYEAALPLLLRAVTGLRSAGPADPYEGYANYNLGYTLLQLGRCAEAKTYLRQADRLEPDNRYVHAALKRASKCGDARSGQPPRGVARGRRSR